MSPLVGTMVGVAVWHFAVFLPDRFRGEGRSTGEGRRFWAWMVVFMVARTSAVPAKA